MNKEVILARLNFTLELLHAIREHEFDISDIVTKYDYQRNCGTICCIVGWYPKYIPQAGFKWNRSEYLAWGISHDSGNNTVDALSLYHGLNKNLIELIFGFCNISRLHTIIDKIIKESPNITQSIIIKYSEKSPGLIEVRRMFEYIRDLVALQENTDNKSIFL